MLAKTMVQDLDAISWSVRRKAPVTYIGWLNRGNIGDEAMFLSHQEHLPGKRLAKAPINAWSRGLASLSGPVETQTLLVGGGTILGHAGWLKSITEARRLLRPKRFVVLGAAMEDIGFALDKGLATESSLKAWRELLQQADFIGLRGPRSRQALQRLGVESQVVGDPGLWLGDATQAVSKQAKPRTRPFVAINLIACANGFSVDHSSRRAEVLRFTEEVVKEGLEAVFFGMERRDVEYARNLQKSMPSIRVRSWNPSVADLLTFLSRSEAVVAERLHGAILALSVSRPFVILSYKPKSYDFAESVDALDWCIDPVGFSTESILETLAKVTSDATQLARVERARDALRKRFDHEHQRWLLT